MIPNIVKFCSYLIFLPISIACSLFVLYQFIFNRRLRYALNNHGIGVVVLLGLICELTDYPWLLHYYRNEGKWERSLAFCQIWGFINWGLYTTQTIIFAWVTIERHILVFHINWLSTSRRRFFIHYLPLLILCLYCFITYYIVYFFPPCTNYVDYFYVTCVAACLFEEGLFSMLDTIINEVLPVFIIVIFSIILLIRVLWRKYHMSQSVRWKKQRKLVIQLLLISFIYILLLSPFTFVDFILVCGFSRERILAFRQYALYLHFFMTLFFPYICILSLHELRVRFKRFIHFHRHFAHVFAFRQNVINISN